MPKTAKSLGYTEPDPRDDLGAHALDRDDLRLFSFAEDAEEVWTRLVAGGLKLPTPKRR